MLSWLTIVFSKTCLSQADSGHRRGPARQRGRRRLTATVSLVEGGKVSLFRYRALVTLDPPRPGQDETDAQFPSGTHKLMVHAWRAGKPPHDKYFAAEIWPDEDSPLRPGVRAIVTITVTDDDAPDYLGPGRMFSLWGGGTGRGIVSRRVFSNASPS